MDLISGNNTNRYNYNIVRYEKALWMMGERYVAGIDEAGRGPLAGPVVAACVIMPPKPFFETINDSKKLSNKKREELYFKIKETAIDYSISIVNSDIIDRVNIFNASKKAFLDAALGLRIKPHCIFTDAMPLNEKFNCIELIKGDSRSYNIAAASILAKYTRDEIMCSYSDIYPEYNFSRHKGYGTREHREKILKYGISPIHRKSFLKNLFDKKTL